MRNASLAQAIWIGSYPNLGRVSVKTLRVYEATQRLLEGGSVAERLTDAATVTETQFPDENA